MLQILLTPEIGFSQNFVIENMTKSKHENASSRALELDLAHTKDRLAAKEKEVEGLYKQILNQDKAFAEAYREQEASFREREEKLIVKLFDEVGLLTVFLTVILP